MRRCAPDLGSGHRADDRLGTGRDGRRTDAATAILLHLQARTPANGTGSGLIPVIEDHAAVHQATGIVSVRASVTLTEALVLLRARAFAADRPIVALSRDVVAGLVHFTNGSGEIDNG